VAASGMGARWYGRPRIGAISHVGKVLWRLIAIRMKVLYTT
jgi:hypothetical protein